VRMNEHRSRRSPPADLLLILHPLRSQEQASLLARAAGWLLMFAGVIVALLGFLMNHPPTMIEATLVALLALIAGWARSRFAATLLALLLGLGLAGAVAGGIATGTIVFLLIAVLVSLRLLEASFRFRAPRGGEQHG
jgi:type IV secretion system protein TrbC